MHTAHKQHKQPAAQQHKHHKHHSTTRTKMPNRANPRAERLIDFDGGSKLRDFDGNLLAVSRTAKPVSYTHLTLPTKA